MDSVDDLELEGNDTTRSKSSQGVRKNIAIKLKNGDGASKSRGRSKKSARSSSRSSAKPKKESPVVAEKTVTEDDIIEGMEFTTMKVAGAEPMHKMQKLRWDHKVNLLGIKVIDPIIHTCETCNLPILIYGRMIPCKHVFCLDCAKKSEKVCSRCGDPVNRVEQSALGAVFVCNFGGSKHGVSGCRRTYLSQRDLQAHINYRHLKQQSDQQTKPAPVSQASAPVVASTSSLTVQPNIQTGNYGLSHSPALMSPTVPIVQQPAAQAASLMQPQHEPNMLYPPPMRTDGIGHGLSNLQPPTNPQIHQSLNVPISQAAPVQAPMPSQPVHMAPPPVSNPVDTYQNIPVMATRTSNLITVPIQDESDYTRHDASQYPTSSAGGQYMPPSMQQPMLSNAPPSHYSAVSHPSQMPGYSSGNHQPPQGMPAVSHPPPQTMISTCPQILNAPLNLPGVNLSQPPPNTPMGMPPQPRPATGGLPPMMANRYPNPGGQTMFNQPPPTNTRTWPGAPPPQSGHMGGPPGQMAPAQRVASSSANMGPMQSRPFYH